MKFLKNINFIVFASFICCFLLEGCLSKDNISGYGNYGQPPAELFQKWNFGPFPLNYRDIVSNHKELKSISTSKEYLSFQGKPVKKWLSNRIGKDWKYGWMGYVEKSSHEIGNIKYRYMIRNGEIILFEKVQNSSNKFLY